MAGNWRVWWRCGHSFCLLLCFPSFCRPMTTSLWLQMKMTFSLLTAVHHYPLTGVKGFQLCPGSHRRKMRSDDKILGRSTSEAVSLVTHFTGTNDANQIPRLAPGQMDLCCSQARNECSVQQIQLTYNEQLCFSGLQCILLQLLLKKGISTCWRTSGKFKTVPAGAHGQHSPGAICCAGDLTRSSHSCVLWKTSQEGWSGGCTCT